MGLIAEEHPVHRCERVPEDVRDEVGVAVGGGADVPVAKHVLHDTQRYTLCDQERRAIVSEVGEAQAPLLNWSKLSFARRVRNARPFAVRAERVDGDVARVEWRTVRRREYEVGRLPHRAGGEPFLQLSGAVGAERADADLGDWELLLRQAGLRREKDEALADAAPGAVRSWHALECVADVDRPRLEVEVFPAQR